MNKEEIKTKLKVVTENAKRIIYDIPKRDLAIELNCTRVTLDRRLKLHNWTHEEKLIIDELRKQYV